MYKKHECPVCGTEFLLASENHYISRDKIKEGLSQALHSEEPTLYDSFDCPQCGCQIIIQPRKQFWLCESYTNDEQDSNSEGEQINEIGVYGGM